MSDERDLTDGPPDPLDAAYRDAEARLDDDTARAARRARLLAAVAADAGAAQAPAEASPLRPARRYGGWRTGGWLVAACVAGLALFVAVQNYAPMFQPPPPSAAPAVSAPAVSAPTLSAPMAGQTASGQAATAAPPADGVASSSAGGPSAPADQARLTAPQADEPSAAPPKASPSPAEPPNAQAERRDELAMAPPPAPPPPPPSPPPPPPATEAPRGMPQTASPAPPVARPPILSGRNGVAAPAPQPSAGYATAGPPTEADDSVRGGADRDDEHAARALPDRGAALRDAAATGRVADVEGLLAQGTPVDAADAQGNTALMRSIQSDQPAAAAALRRHGASLDRRNHAGQSARDMAAARGDPALARAVGVGQ